MQTWLDVLSRGLAMLLTATALGIGPAAFLGRRFDAAGRLAIAPAIGLCLGISIFTTLVWFTPAASTYWLLPVLAAASVVVALIRAGSAPGSASGSGGRASVLRRALGRIGVRDLLLLAAVCGGVAAGPVSVMVARHSVGPFGFRVWDADGYVAVTDGEQQQALRDSVHNAKAPFANLEEAEWVGYTRGYQNLDASPLSADLNELLGLHATDTQGAFLIALLIIGALGGFASVRYVVGKPVWAAAVAGLLFAGPFFLQLVSDGSQAAICGLALLLPLAVVGVDALREPRVATLVVFAVLVGGLLSVYPLFVPTVTFGAVVALTAALIRRRRTINRKVMAVVTGRLAGVLLLAVSLNLVSFMRDLRYWKGVVTGSFSLAGLLVYQLPPDLVPGWLLQTREFYLLTPLTPSSPIRTLLLGLVAPAALVVVMVLGVARFRVAAVVVALIVVSGGLAYYAIASTNCSYCEDRDLLPIAPISAFLIALGVAALSASAIWGVRKVGVVVALGTLLIAGVRSADERLAVTNGGYMLDAANADVLGRLPAAGGRVQLEGFNEVSVLAPGELPLTYDLVEERTGGRASILSTVDDFAGLAYFGGPHATLGPEFSPNYEYVLTRAWGVRTARRLVAHRGAVSLERRTNPLDVLAASGLFLEPAQLDAKGFAWVANPVTFAAVGGTTQRPVWVSLVFQTNVPAVRVSPAAGTRWLLDSTGGLHVCIRATGMAPVRYAGALIVFNRVLTAAPDEPFAPLTPLTGVRLTSMLVSDLGCTDRGLHA